MHTLEVPSSLARFVRSIRIWEDPGGEVPEDYQRLPDGESELVAHAGRGSVVGTWIGTRTAPLRKPTTHRDPALLVRFRAGGSYAFFREPMSAFTDRVVPLADVWGDAIHDADDIDAVARATLATLENKLQSTAEHEPASVPAIRRAVRLTSEARNLPSVSELANQVGVSERQLRRGFEEVVGLSPKRFLRIARFKRVLRAVRTEERDWVALAQAAGYYDQAHMIGEFRALTGTTPGAFARQYRRRALAGVNALPETDSSHARSRMLAGLLVVGLSLLPYLGVLRGEFVAGDIDFISENPALRAPDLWRKAFAYSYWYQGGDSDPARYYRPLVVLLDGLNLAWFGDDTLGYHSVNQLLHALASLSVWWLMRLLLAQAGLALWAACLFAVHPMQVHAVAYISGRTSILCTLLVIVHVCCVLKADAAEDRRSRLRWCLGASMAFACALLTKEHAVVAPLLAVCALWGRSLGFATSLRRRAPWLAVEIALGLVYLLVRKLVLGHVGASTLPVWQQLSPLAALLSLAKIVVFYPARLLWPSGLSYLPVFTPAFDASSLSGWCALIVLAVWLAAIVQLREREPLGCALSAWTLIALAPVSGVVPLEYFVKEHHAYLAAAGFVGLIALIAERGLQRLPAIDVRLRRIAAAAVVCALALSAQLHAAHFQNVRALYERVVELEPAIADADFARPVMRGAAERFAVTHLNLGLLELKAGAFAPAHAHFERAEQLARSKGLRFQTRFLSADSLLGQGDLDGAERAFGVLSADEPKRSEPEAKLAQIAARRGRKDDMLAHLKAACARGGRDACARAAQFER